MEYQIQTDAVEMMYGSRSYQSQGETAYNNAVKYSPQLRKPTGDYMIGDLHRK